jgi:hypothetical protein
MDVRMRRYPIARIYPDELPHLALTGAETLCREPVVPLRPGLLADLEFLHPPGQPGQLQALTLGGPDREQRDLPAQFHGPLVQGLHLGGERIGAVASQDVS